MEEYPWTLPFVWLMLQMTAIGVAAWLLIVFGNRRSISNRIWVSMIGLCLMALTPLALLAPSPLSFRTVDKGSSSSFMDREMSDVERERIGSLFLGSPADGHRFLDWTVIKATGVILSIIDPKTATTPNPNEAVLQQVEATRQSWSIVGVLACIAGLSIGIGWSRLIFGMIQIARLRKESKVIDSQVFIRLLPQEFQCNKLTELIVFREHRSLRSPTVIGVISPCVVMPADWSTWNPIQLKAVLLHELAHIQRHDLRYAFCAQMALACTYFHPLSHWLMLRIRIDQEYAADAMAAQGSGSAASYLKSLASLALRRVDTKIDGPALAFLPTRRILTRRIKMLQSVNGSNYGRSQWKRALAQIVLLAAFAMLVLNLRPLIAQQPATPQNPKLTLPLAQSNAAVAEDVINYLPASGIIAAVRVDLQTLLKSSLGAQLLATIPLEQRVFERPGIRLPVEQIDTMLMLVSGPETRRGPVLVLRVQNGFDWRKGQSKSSASPAAPPQDQFEELDDRTIVLSGDTQSTMKLAETLKNAAKSGVSTELKKKIERHSQAAVRGAIDLKALKSITPIPPPLMLAQPIIQASDSGSVGFSISDKFDFSAILDSSAPRDVADTLNALKTLALASLKSMTAPTAGTPAAEFEQRLFAANDFLIETVSGVAIDPADSMVKVHSTGVIPKALIDATIQGMASMRAQAAKSRELSSLKQIVLAMHMYHDVHGHFPPSVIVENGIERSWRVELLPYLEQQELYNRYHVDQAWDSPENSVIGETIVPTYAFHSSTDIPQATSTGFRAVGGEKRLFNKTGRKLTEISDGTSNTIALVSVKDTVPWTKPDVYDPTPQALMQAATDQSGLAAAFADGSARILSSKIDLTNLESMLTPAGGELIRGDN